VRVVDLGNDHRLVVREQRADPVGVLDLAAEVELELRAQQLRPDALIVDYRLAEAMDGPQVIEYLRAAFGAELPALIITGTANLPLLRERAVGIPIAMKPASPGKLRAFLSQSRRQRTGA